MKNKAYANMCVLSTFGADKQIVDTALAKINLGNAKIEFVEKNLQGKIIVGKQSVDKVALTVVLNQIYKVLGEYIYADCDIDLNQIVSDKLKDCGAMVSTAESITGGLIASKLCEINGASEVLYEGLVTYNSAAKVRRLHVPMGLIELETAVSEPVCAAMLSGVLSNKEIGYALTTTGYASDMSDMNGLAYIGCGNHKQQIIKEVKYSGKRNEIREKVANCALFMLLRMIERDNVYN